MLPAKRQKAPVFTPGHGDTRVAGPGLPLLLQRDGGAGDQGGQGQGGGHPNHVVGAGVGVVVTAGAGARVVGGVAGGALQRLVRDDVAAQGAGL